MAIVEVVQKNPTVMGPREHGVSSLHLCVWGGGGGAAPRHGPRQEHHRGMVLLFIIIICFFPPDRLEDTTVCDGGQLAKAAGGCLPINTEI